MADAAKEKVISKPPVSLGMYRSSHKRDYQWCEQYKAPSEEDIQKLQVADSQLKAKEFAVPREQQVVTSSDGLVGEGREVIPAPSIPASSRADNAGESYLPKYHPATELAAARAEELERLQGFAMPEKLMSYCQHLPAAAQTPETAEVHPQKLVPAWATYQHFTMEMFRAMQHDAQQNKSTNMGTSLSMPDFNRVKMLMDKNESWFSNFSSAASSFVKGGGSWAGVGLQEVVIGLILTLIDLITLLGNTIVFICPVVEKRLRTVTYMFIMSLAMADFLVACLVMPFSIIYEVTGMWLFGKLFCKVWISFDVMFCTASIVTLCFISLDRYCSVVTPYHYSRRMSRGRCILMTCTVWVYSSLISFLPVMQGWNEIPGVDFDAGRECIFVTNWIFAIVASALAFFVPFMVMCSMYFFIYRASRLKATRIMSQTLEIHYHPNSKRQNHLQLENKATRTISIIISAFVLCWLPYFVLNVWLAARGTDSTSTVLVDTFKIITWLGYCNSTINPMLYAFLNRDFQRALKKLLVCRHRSQVDIGEDMVSIATFSKTAPELEYSIMVPVPNGALKGKPKQ
ncbi:PREDICTED: histamine H2 receptor-like [Chaetura pelagica]|uniref:histamine H2 receptor-like n=1 Tax=Chaetura pelagica TaxID=8897 RepID=UPI000523DF47|nr:PREDICTED: histamine H2 receptor-like [Chaetura pelagica]